MLIKNADEFSFFWHKKVNQQEKGGRFIRNLSCDVFIGHVRAATIGSVNDDNAHPFAMEKLVGAHNGTLKDAEFQHEEKTDSEMMFAKMNETGVNSVLSNLHRDSAYAVTIYDKINKNLIFARNEKRGLWIAHSKERDVVYWASEGDALRYILGRMGIDYIGPLLFSPGKLWTLPLRSISRKTHEIFKIDELEKPKSKLSLVPSITKTGEYQERGNKRIKSQRIEYVACVCCKAPLGPIEQFKAAVKNDGTMLCDDCSGDTEKKLDDVLEREQEYLELFKEKLEKLH